MLAAITLTSFKSLNGMNNIIDNIYLHACRDFFSWTDGKWCWLKDLALLSELLLCVHFSVNERRLYIIYYDIFRSTASDLRHL